MYLSLHGIIVGAEKQRYYRAHRDAEPTKTHAGAKVSLELQYRPGMNLQIQMLLPHRVWGRILLLFITEAWDCFYYFVLLCFLEAPLIAQKSDGDGCRNGEVTVVAEVHKLKTLVKVQEIA